MRNVIAFLVCTMTAFAGYTSKATLTFAAASGSSADTDITLAFSGSDAKLRSVANGGQVEHTVTRVGVTVPADFVLTSDPTCTTVAGGYTWGIESYSASAGTIIGWAMIPSLTTNAPAVPTVCIGNSAVSTYQGGAQGAEFDSHTQGVWHFPNGSTLEALDFAAGAHDGTNTGAGAGTGKIDGASTFAGAWIDFPQAAISGDTSVTFSLWINTTNPNRQFALGSGVGVCGSNGFASIETSNSSTVGALIRSDAGTAQTAVATSDGNWHRLVGIYTPATLSIQVDNGTPVVTTGLTNPPIGPSSTFEAGNLCSNFGGGAYAFSGSIDELSVAGVVRSADWISTEFANQSNLPVISAFSTLGPSLPPSAATLSSQGFVF